MQCRLSAEQLEQRAAAVRLAVFDVDGVLTDGGLLFNHEGQESKRFHAHDGIGLKRLMRAGIEVAVITARSSEVVRIRMAELGINHVYQGESEKLTCLRGLGERLNLAMEQVCYAGDDAPDRACMQAVGLACSVADATDDALSVAHWVTSRGGGQGAVRQICDLLIAAQDTNGQ